MRCTGLTPTRSREGPRGGWAWRRGPPACGPRGPPAWRSELECRREPDFWSSSAPWRSAPAAGKQPPMPPSDRPSPPRRSRWVTGRSHSPWEELDTPSIISLPGVSFWTTSAPPGLGSASNRRRRPPPPATPPW